MLAERVVTEKDMILRQVAEHAVRPMKHGGLDEHQLTATQTESIPCFHRHEIPVLMKVSLERFYGVLRAVYGGIGYVFHQFRQGAAVIRLGVICNDKVDFVEIDPVFEMFDKLHPENIPYRIYQHGFFIPDKVCIVGRPTVCRIFRAVKPPYLPIDFAYPINRVFYPFHL
jgi:hypothetical protein